MGVALAYFSGIQFRDPIKIHNELLKCILIELDKLNKAKQVIPRG